MTKLLRRILLPERGLPGRSSPSSTPHARICSVAPPVSNLLRPGWARSGAALGLVAGLALLSLALAAAGAPTLPETDQRLHPPRDLNTLRSFPAIATKGDWQARAAAIREQVLISCGLWPLPARTPLNTQIFGRVEREGYTVEKVYFETLPGFYLAGNLYRPLGKGSGPFPAILNPHGHWRNGRMADVEEGSIAARCINFAKQGMIAFSYDMVGYNDTIQVNHTFAKDQANQLWQISLMGLQTWNSIRALDFLESLPDADKKRLACTGESGGGTQTFMLGAVDQRLAVQGPIVMVSHSMQGGCQCENAPGLRVEYSNMELAAAPAPRPQILVAASGDWTKKTMEVEGPALESVYRLFRAPQKLRYVLFNFDHNYNKTSREAVYEWFGHWLLRNDNASSLKEVPYKKEPDNELRVWPDGKLPANALNESQLINALVARSQSQWASLKPAAGRSLEAYKRVLLPAWKHSLQVEIPTAESLVQVPGKDFQTADYKGRELALGRKGRGDRLPVTILEPAKRGRSQVVVLAHPDGRAGGVTPTGEPTELARKFLESGFTVLLLDTFLTGSQANPELAKVRQPFQSYFSTYNRTDAQERAQDLITACVFARTIIPARTASAALGAAKHLTHHGPAARRHSGVLLCGQGRAGLWALLAAPAADALIADADTLEERKDQSLLAPDLFFPGLRKLGSFEGIALLAAPHPLLVHNTGDQFSLASLAETYQRSRSKSFRHELGRLGNDALVEWAKANCSH